MALNEMDRQHAARLRCFCLAGRGEPDILPMLPFAVAPTFQSGEPAMPMMKCNCPKCQTALTLNLDLPSRVQCPRCGAAFMVGGPAAAAAPPPPGVKPGPPALPPRPAPAAARPRPTAAGAAVMN